MNTVVENAIERIKYVRDARNERVLAIESEIKELQTKLNELAKPFDDEIARYEEQIKLEVLQMESSYASGNSKITFVKGYVRYSWLKDKLEGYFTAIGEDIEKFREKSEVKPQVRIKIE